MIKSLVICCLPAFETINASTLCVSLKSSFDDIQVDFLVHEDIACVFEEHSAIDNVLAVRSNSKNTWDFITSIRKIAKENYDIIVDLSPNIVTQFLRLTCSSVKQAIWLNGLKPSNNRVASFSDYLPLLNPLISHGYDIKKKYKPAVVVNQKEKLEQRNVLVSHGVDLNRPLFAFIVSAEMMDVKWPSDLMGALIDHYLVERKLQIVLICWPNKNIRDIEETQQHITDQSNLFSKIEVKGFASLIGLLANCDAVVGNVGVPIQLAHAIGLKTISIYPPRSVKTLLPTDSDEYSIHWQDVCRMGTQPEYNFEIGDSFYLKLHQSIRPSNVMPLIDQII